MFAKIALIASLLISAPVFAQVRSQLLSPMDVDLHDFAPPPVPGSVTDTQDLEFVRGVSQTRTEAQCALANADASLDLKTIFGGKDLLTDTEVTEFEASYFAIFQTTDFFVSELKGRWNRPRPYVRDPSIKLCIGSHPATSYPSGHAAISRVTARLLGLKYPERRLAFLRRANEVAWGRVIGGVHHPADIAAGKRLGDFVYQALLDKKIFAAEPTPKK